VPFAAKLSRLPDVVRVESSVGGYSAGRPTSPADPRMVANGIQRIAVVTTADPRSAAAKALVGNVRAMPEPYLVGGTTAEFIDSQHAIGSRLLVAGGLIALTTFILLFLFTGSLLQPLRALLLNVIGLSATLGAMVLIFQDGHLSGWLGFTPLPLDTSMLVLLFCITFGLSMDYEVFVISRIKEQHLEGAVLRDAVTGGLARSGRIVSMAAVILSVSFFAFGTSSVSFLQLFGIGSGLAVLIDATLIRGVLLPAGLRLLGRWAWWSPGPLRSLYGRVGLSEASPS
jgi:putative drug exporter of the RND superfamily